MRLRLMLTALLLATSSRVHAQSPAGLGEWRTLPNGSQILRLAGGKSPTELTTFRIRYPTTFQFDSTPHYHLGTEHVIVLKGTLMLGLGDRIDRGKVVAYGPGSFFELTAGTPHFEWAVGELEAQVSHVGPMTTIFIRSDNEWPRRQETH